MTLSTRSDNFVKTLDKEQLETRRRILEISHKFHFSHLGSCFSAVDLIDAVYKIKKPDEKFVLSNGHAGIALYVILEKYGFIRDTETFKKLYVHPDRNTDLGIHVSTGSLGHGLPIALGMAFADRSKNVYCMISDGECAEGSVWETFRIAAEKKAGNLKIILNANGWGAYGNIALPQLMKRIKSFDLGVVVINGHDMNEIIKALKIKTDQPLVVFAKTVVGQFPFLKDQDAHYYIMSDQDYLSALDSLLWS